MILITALLVSCTSAKNRGDRNNIFQDLASPYQPMPEQQRSGNIYRNFVLQLEVDAIFKDVTYLTGLSDAGIKAGRFEKPEAQKIATAGSAGGGNDFEFVLLIYQPNEGTMTASSLQQNWHFNLIIDDLSLTPRTIEKIATSNFEYQYLTDKVYAIDRWSQLFLISFPNSSDLDLADTKNLTASLKISGIQGSTTLVWENFGQLLANNQ